MSFRTQVTSAYPMAPKPRAQTQDELFVPTDDDGAGAGAVIVTEGPMLGMWVRRTQQLTFKQQKRILEMVLGRAAVLHAQGKENMPAPERLGPIQLADETRWSMLLMLIVAGQAHKVKL